LSTRSQVYLADSGVYLYQHMDGYMLPEIVQAALIQKERWDDEEYLNRIIFCEMVQDHIHDSTGYGIGTQRHGDIEWLVTVNVERQTVKIEQGYDEDMKVLYENSFEDFIKTNVSEEKLLEVVQE